MWKTATRWLWGQRGLRESECVVNGCEKKPVIVIAGAPDGTTRMCVPHALAWSESSLCHDYAQHNSGATDRAMSTWIESTAEARREAEVHVLHPGVTVRGVVEPSLG